MVLTMGATVFWMREYHVGLIEALLALPKVPGVAPKIETSS